MLANLDMGGENVINLPENRTDDSAAVSKKYVSTVKTTLHTQLTLEYQKYVDGSYSSPSGHQRNRFKYLVEDIDESSS